MSIGKAEYVMSKISGIVLAASCFLFAVRSQASELVYQPVNPTFGGNPFNSAHLLAGANAQNDYKDPNAPPPATEQSLADQFTRQLQSQLLIGLAQKVSDAIFGPDPQSHGKIVFGGQTVTYDHTLDSIDLTITDSSTGATTQISVPTLVTTQ